MGWYVISPLCIAYIMLIFSIAKKLLEKSELLKGMMQGIIRSIRQENTHLRRCIG